MENGVLLGEMSGNSYARKATKGPIIINPAIQF